MPGAGAQLVSARNPFSLPAMAPNAAYSSGPGDCRPWTRPYTSAPGRNPAANRVSSHPVTSTTRAPERRRCSARSAQSANSGASCSGVSSHGNGENHTSRPAAAAAWPATLSRSGRPPEIRTAVQASSAAITRISRRTMSGSKSWRLIVPPGETPVS